MGKPIVIMLGILWAVLMNSCGPNGAGYPLSITVKNAADADVVLTAVSEKVKHDAEICIKPHEQTVLYAELAGDIDFTLRYNTKTYTANTGYADDYRTYTIQFSENADNEIECYFIVKNLTRRISLEEINK